MLKWCFARRALWQCGGSGSFSGLFAQEPILFIEALLLLLSLMHPGKISQIVEVMRVKAHSINSPAVQFAMPGWQSFAVNCRRRSFVCFRCRC